jgi:sarcosine oxidase subunit gamma
LLWAGFVKPIGNQRHIIFVDDPIAVDIKLGLIIEMRLDGVRADLDGLAAVTDQGDGRVVLEVSGSRARDALAKGVPVDLDPIAFKVGDAAQTSASHIGLQIALVDDTPTFEITSARSTAGSLWSWLVASAAEYGIEVV